jgi:hypothetical protein
MSTAANSLVLACPICNDCNLHLGPVSTTQAGDTITIGYSRPLGGPTLSHSFRASVPDRGSQVRLSFVGECGHSATLCFWFRKGCTFYEWENLSTFRGDSEEQFASTLWRD